MSKSSRSDFKVTKKRVGREHLRKHKSLDEKLLSNLSRVKKSVKLSTQSITLKKDGLNVTSRRLTLPELVGRSRHPSENVRNHALVGLSEFIRRYEEEGRTNVYILLQVSCASLLSESSQLRTSSKNLLMSTLATYFPKPEKCSKKCSEIIHLYLVQGTLAEGSTNQEFSEDMYGLINLILERHPKILKEYHEKLLKALLQNKPDSLSFRHFSCVYTLFKLVPKINEELRRELVEYVIDLEYKLITETNPIIEEGSKNKVVKRSVDKKSSVQINNEIECLSKSSMVVKGFKILLKNTNFIKKDDSRIADIMLTSDLIEMENMTERGKETFKKLFSELVITKSRLSIKLIPEFSKHHLALIIPLVQLESMKESLEESKVVEILLEGVSRPREWKVNTKVNAKWANRILKVLTYSKLERIANFVNYLRSLVNNNNQFGPFSDKQQGQEQGQEGSISEHEAEEEEEEEQQILEKDKGGNSIKKANKNKDKNMKNELKGLYEEILNELFKSVVRSPTVWPLVALLKGVPSVLLKSIFGKSQLWSYIREQKEGEGGEYEGNNEGVSNDGLSFGSEFRINWKINFDMEEVMEYFIREVRPGLVETFLNLCLHISKDDNKGEFYMKLSEIREINEENYKIMAKVMLNLKTSDKLKEYIKSVIVKLFNNEEIESCKEFINVMGFHTFNSNSPGRLDSQGRIQLNFDQKKEILNQVEYYVNFYIDLVELEYNLEGSSDNEGKEEEGAKEGDKEDVNCPNFEKKVKKGFETSSRRSEAVKYALKVMIDKYLLEMCKVEGEEDLKSTMDNLVEECLKVNYEKMEPEMRSWALKGLREVLLEYLDKDSMPEWIPGDVNHK